MSIPSTSKPFPFWKVYSARFFLIPPYFSPRAIVSLTFFLVSSLLRKKLPPFRSPFLHLWPCQTLLDLPLLGTFILRIQQAFDHPFIIRKLRILSCVIISFTPICPTAFLTLKRKCWELGLSSVEELYRTVIPEDLLFQGTMDLPAPLLSEQALKRHVNSLLAQNTSTEDAISFLGAGCYKRYIPAVCDEIANRSEFLTAYCGDTYSDHGKCRRSSSTPA